MIKIKVGGFIELWSLQNLYRRDSYHSTSDTGQAVELRDGFFAAELRAKDIETAFKASEQEHLKVVLRIMRDTVDTNLKLSDIESHFTRCNYENIATKSQVLISTLNSPWIHLEVAYASCGMFPDPESAYLQGKAWYDQQENKKKTEAERIADSGTGAMSRVQQATGGNEGLLEAALENAFSGFGGQEFYPSKEEKGARLGYELISNHAFVDGNKRIGMYVMLTFLEVNGIRLECTNEDVAEVGLAVAAIFVQMLDIIDLSHFQHLSSTSLKLRPL